MNIITADDSHIYDICRLNERVLVVDGLNLSESFRVPSLVRKNSVLVAMQENTLLGALTYDLPDENWVGRSNEFREIVTLAVNPSYQKMGIGAKLVSALEEKLINLGNIQTLYVGSYRGFHCSEFYKKVGFILMRSDENYYFRKDFFGARPN